MHLISWDSFFLNWTKTQVLQQQVLAEEMLKLLHQWNAEKKGAQTLGRTSW